ncbi:MAG: hypothetical protein Tsb0020_49490 [Haliangiales bacterium]
MKKLLDILTRYGLLAESVLLETGQLSRPLEDVPAKPSQPVTRARLKAALAWFAGEQSMSDRWRRELAECCRAGLLPLELSNAALEDESLWERPISAREALDQVSDELIAWCEDFIAAYPEQGAALSEDEIIDGASRYLRSEQREQLRAALRAQRRASRDPDDQ